MKLYKTIYLPLAISCAVAITGCGDGADMPQSISPAALTVEVGMEDMSRDPIMGNVLPDGSTYAVMCVDKDNTETSYRQVSYNDGVSSIIGDPVILGDKSYKVEAFYPSPSDGNLANLWTSGLHVDARTQTDYLYGATQYDYSYNSSYANVYLRHIMSLVTLRIRKDNFITSEYHLNSIQLDNAIVEGDYSLQKGAFVKYYGGAELSLSTGKLVLTSDYYDLDLIMMPSPSDMCTSIILEIYGKDGKRTVDFKHPDWVAGYHYVYNVTVSAESMTVDGGEIQPWTTATAVNVGAAESAPGNAVDLGLSVLWADRNVGAYSSYSYGGYFSPETFTLIWDGAWTVPTAEDFEELFSKCHCEWATVNNVNGIKVTGNGNSIFMPASGWNISGGMMHDLNWQCLYSTSSAKVAVFGKDISSPGFIAPQTDAMYSVRPVTKK